MRDSDSPFDKAVQWLVTWGLAALVVVVTATYHQASLKGPEFIKQFTFLGIGGLVVGLLVRFVARRHLASYVIAALLSWEAIALLRIVYGMNHGMSKFGNLVIMMFVGPFAMAITAFAESRSGGGGGGSVFGGCSSCGSSCGGGCGGGGCGGCS